MSTDTLPILSGIVVHWYDETRVRELAAAWPIDPRFELVVVDNGSREDLTVENGRVLRPGHNLGFAGAVNLGLRETRGSILLILNSDVRPESGALAELLSGFDRLPQAAGLAPRLIGDDGKAQFRWQLRDLPSPATLLMQALMLPVGQNSSREPPSGSQVEQPAAAALALRRESLEAAGGFDEGFFPAWFEDVDLAKRLSDQGASLCYWPQAQFTHELGATVPQLGYGPFLWVYYANLCRYLRKHHSRLWSVAAAGLLLPAVLIRLAVLPIRAPKLARSRADAARGLLVLAQGALSGWRSPDRYPPSEPLEIETGER